MRASVQVHAVSILSITEHPCAALLRIMQWPRGPGRRRACLPARIRLTNSCRHVGYEKCGVKSRDLKPYLDWQLSLTVVLEKQDRDYFGLLV